MCRRHEAHTDKGEWGRGYKPDLRNGGPLAVCLDGFPYSWVVLLIKHIHHLIVYSSLIQQRQHFEREAALWLRSGTLDECHYLQTGAKQFV